MTRVLLFSLAILSLTGCSELQIIGRAAVNELQAEAINAGGQVLRQIAAIGANGEGSPKLIGIAREFPGGCEGSALCVAHFETQFAAHALGVRDCRAEKEESERR